MFHLSFPVAHAVTISGAIPGTSINATSTPGAFVANFYQFALIIAGVLAFGVIVYGGIKYMTSTGNHSATSDAKEWIEAALLGLLLLAGAYFVLKVVNPQLVDLNLPELNSANVAATSASTPVLPTLANGQTACQGKINGQCADAGQKCVNDGDGNYFCQSINPVNYTCSGTHYGSCPGSGQGPGLCLNNGGSTPGTANYSCHVSYQ